MKNIVESIILDIFENLLLKNFWKKEFSGSIADCYDFIKLEESNYL